METEIGFAKDNQGEYKSRPSIHMDAFRSRFCKLLQYKYSDFVIAASVYSPFSNRVGLPLHKIPSKGVLMKSIGADLFMAGCKIKQF